MINTERYKTQMALPEIGPAKQQRLATTKLLMVGAGGLGAAALPYLTGAGIGQITIIDHDVIARDNLHRQTIYKDAQAGEKKAHAAASYIAALNPDTEVRAVAEKITPENAEKLCNGFDLILDGSDNFETKRRLNQTAIRTKTPLISAAVERFEASVGLFAGHLKNAPCYTCLFPTIPFDACNCSEAGILGTAAGLAGLYQAHITLCFLLGIGEIEPGFVLSADFKNFRTRTMRLEKNPACEICNGTTDAQKEIPETGSVEIIHPEIACSSGCLIIDVRTVEEVANDPIPGALHMELNNLPSCYKELPTDKPLAFACGSNIRSMKAARFMRTMGYKNVCVLDRLA